MASHEPEDLATRRVSVEEVEANLRRPIGIDPDRHTHTEPSASP